MSSVAMPSVAMPTVAIDQATTHFKPATSLRRSTVETAILPPSASAVARTNSDRSLQHGGASLFRFVVPVVAIVATLVATQVWNKFRAEPVVVVSQQPAVRSVKVDHPLRATTSNVVLPATIRPWQTTMLHARVSGYLTAWHKDLGAHVKAGEVLAQIETPELDQELAEGKALASEAQAQAIQAKAERQEAAADLKVSEAQLTRARAEASLATLQLARRGELLAKRAISQEDYEIFQKQLETRTADVAAAEADVARRRTNLETRQAIIEAREATAQSRQSNVDRLLELQIFKQIVAPFEGVVTRRTAEVGMLVTAGKESLFVVEDMSRVRVQLNVPQAYAVQARRGVTATINVPESATQTIAGIITRVAESVDSTNRTMLAEIELENGSGRLQPGSYTQVALTVAQDNASWTIPTNTVQMRVEGPHVAIVNEQGQVELKQVTLGRDLGKRLMVEGIRGDERLIVNPSDDLVHGMQVEVGNRELSPKIARH